MAALSQVQIDNFSDFTNSNYHTYFKSDLEEEKGRHEIFKNEKYPIVKSINDNDTYRIIDEEKNIYLDIEDNKFLKNYYPLCSYYDKYCNFVYILFNMSNIELFLTFLNIR